LREKNHFRWAFFVSMGFLIRDHFPAAGQLTASNAILCTYFFFVRCLRFFCLKRKWCGQGNGLVEVGIEIRMD
jgi:hypothetical protein